MLTRNEVKYVRSLQSGKFRQIHKQYVVEGVKLVAELLRGGHPIDTLYATEEFVAAHNELISNTRVNLKVISEAMLGKISGLATPHQALAVVPMSFDSYDLNHALAEGLYVALDALQDPGNMGTILRSADWFGVRAVFCSPATVDVYNPKVVQASMGALFRLPVYYVDLYEFFTRRQHISLYAAVMNGNNVYTCSLPRHAILLIGNESRGISSNLLPLVDERITIPRFGQAESLNAAVACSILLALWRKNHSVYASAND